MNLFKKMALVPALALSASAVMGLSSSAVAAEWQPRKPVEFVIMAGAGGGADKMARLMQTVIQKNDLSPRPFIPVNKPGGSGAEALMHMKSKAKDDHIIMVTLNSFYTTPLRQPALRVKPADFAPIARMAEDTFVLWVNADSGIKTLDDFVAAAKKKGSGWVMAGTGRAGEDELLTHYLNSTFGLSMKYVPFSGGGRVAKELVGKQADSTVNNPSEAMGFYQAERIVPVVTFTKERLPLFPDAPTMTELGHPFEYYMQRSVVGTPGMSAGAQKFYADLFQKVYATPEWQKFIEVQSLQGEFMTGTDLLQYWERENANHVELLSKVAK